MIYGMPLWDITRFFIIAQQLFNPLVVQGSCIPDRLVFIAPNHQVVDLVYGKNMEKIQETPVNSIVKYGKNNGIHGISVFFLKKQWPMTNDQRKNHSIFWRICQPYNWASRQASNHWDFPNFDGSCGMWSAHGPWLCLKMWYIYIYYDLFLNGQAILRYTYQDTATKSQVLLIGVHNSLHKLRAKEEEKVLLRIWDSQRASEL